MVEHPIIFSTPMVKAILEGRKTMTRRIIKPQPYVTQGENVQNPWNLLIQQKGQDYFSWQTFIKYRYPNQIGDHLWVKETWRIEKENPIRNPDGQIYDYDLPTIMYKASKLPHIQELFKDWRPSIFMSRWASRINLEITNIKVEKLQDITPDDVEKEGLKRVEIQNNQWYFPLTSDLKTYTNNATIAFTDLWNSINGKTYNWDSNPWVWVIEFKTIKDGK